MHVSGESFLIQNLQPVFVGKWPGVPKAHCGPWGFFDEVDGKVKCLLRLSDGSPCGTEKSTKNPHIWKVHLLNYHHAGEDPTPYK